MRKLRLWLWGLVAVVGLAVLLRSRAGRGHSSTLPAYATLPPFSLVDQAGQPLNLQSLRGTVWIADFIFTSCTESCPALTSRMKQLDRALTDVRPPGSPARTTGGSQTKPDPPIRLVSFTVDPETDTPARLAAYAEKWGAVPPRWSFVTGATDEVQRVVTQGFKLGIDRIDRGPRFDIVHANRFVLIDATGTIRGYYDSESAEEMTKIIQDAHTLESQRAH